MAASALTKQRNGSARRRTAKRADLALVEPLEGELLTEDEVTRAKLASLIEEALNGFDDQFVPSPLAIMIRPFIPAIRNGIKRLSADDIKRAREICREIAGCRHD